MKAIFNSRDDQDPLLTDQTSILVFDNNTKEPPKQQKFSEMKDSLRKEIENDGVVKRLFEKIDGDNSGKISALELKKEMSNVNKKFTLEDAGKVIDLDDVNDDKEIDFSEFIKSNDIDQDCSYKLIFCEFQNYEFG